MVTLPTCRREIETLHEFFVDWYAGALPETAFDRLEDALVPGFEMVTPEGVRRDRGSVLDGIHENHGRDAPGAFDIDIRNVEVIATMDEYATVRYEEWQEQCGESTGRISTVLFREDSDAPGGVVWLDLQETWIDTR